jgi:hypothetical protein
MLSKLPQDRHPERSASRIYRPTERFMRVVEGPRGFLLADALHSFPATKTTREIKKVTISERTRISYLTALTVDRSRNSR